MNYTIAEVSSRTRDWTGQGNSKNRSYYVKVEGDDKVYEIAQKVDREPPKAGDSLEATVETREHEGTTYYKLKREYQQRGGGGGGKGPRTEAEEKWISARFAVEEATKLATTGHIGPDQVEAKARGLFALVVELAP